MKRSPAQFVDARGMILATWATNCPVGRGKLSSAQEKSMTRQSPFAFFRPVNFKVTILFWLLHESINCAKIQTVNIRSPYINTPIYGGSIIK